MINYHLHFFPHAMIMWLVPYKISQILKNTVVQCIYAHPNFIAFEIFETIGDPIFLGGKKETNKKMFDLVPCFCSSSLISRLKQFAQSHSQIDGISKWIHCHPHLHQLEVSLLNMTPIYQDTHICIAAS